MLSEENSMSTEIITLPPLSLPVPPSYEQCTAGAVDPRADYVASPLAMAALFAWDDEDD
jgi:hypothetical protein